MEISTMYLTMKEKKAIKRIYDVTHNNDGSLVNYIDIDDVVNTEEDLESCETFCKAIDTVLNLIDKQNKVIDEMIQEYEYNARINVKDFCEECQRKDKCIQDCYTHIKQYFIRKVEEDEH